MFAQRLSKVIAAALVAAASVALVFLMGITVADVVLRAMNPAWRLLGTLDYVEFSLDWVIFLAIPAALFRGEIIVVDLLDNVVRTRILQKIGFALTFLALVAMGSQVIRPALAILEWQERTFDLGILKFWYWMPIWIGLALSSVALLLELIAGRKE